MSFWVVVRTNRSEIERAENKISEFMRPNIGDTKTVPITKGIARMKRRKRGFGKIECTGNDERAQETKVTSRPRMAVSIVLEENIDRTREKSHRIFTRASIEWTIVSLGA